MDFESYEGRVISVLITGKDAKQENYVGKVAKVEDGFMVIDLTGGHAFLDEISFRTELVQSIWVYREDSVEKMAQARKVQLRDKYGLGHTKKAK